MSDERKSGYLAGSAGKLSCNEFGEMVSDAVDGTLSGAQQAIFDRHASACEECNLMLAEVHRGMDLLNSLEEIEPPSTLVHNILARTSHAEETVSPAQTVSMPQQERWSLTGLITAALRPRVLATGAMAFFSLSLMFSMMGFGVSDLRHLDLRPSAIHKLTVRQYYATSARFVRYYKNTRLVYEVESKLRELRNATRDQEQPEKNNRPASDTSRKNQQAPQPNGNGEDFAYTTEPSPQDIATEAALRPEHKEAAVSRRFV